MPVLKGDASCVMALGTSHPALSSTSTASADSYHEAGEWGFKNAAMCSPNLASVDLSGNRITDAGLKIIADTVAFSALRFICLKFNPCQAMPLHLSDAAWTGMCVRKLPTSSKLRLGLQVHTEQAVYSPARSILRLPQQCSEVNALHYTSTVAAAGSGSGSGNRHTDDSNCEQDAKRRFRGSAVHPL